MASVDNTATAQVVNSPLQDYLDKLTADLSERSKQVAVGFDTLRGLLGMRAGDSQPASPALGDEVVQQLGAMWVASIEGMAQLWLAPGNVATSLLARSPGDEPDQKK